MFEFRWVASQLQYRQRGFQVDASGAFCGLTDFGDWKVVKSWRLVPKVDGTGYSIEEPEEDGD